MTTAFLYKWTEISTGMWYRGSRTAKNCHPDDGYICSSKIVKPKILANPSDWVREIECIGESKYILELEAKYLKTLDARNDPMSYNQHNGNGHTGYGIKGSKGPQKNPYKGPRNGHVGIKGPRGPQKKPYKGPRKTPWNKGMILGPKGPQKNPSGPRGPHKNPHKGPRKTWTCIDGKRIYKG